jgi:YbbR domain-containing protein
MTLLRFVFHHWALKLGAVALAIVLYVGMIALQNAQVWSGEVPITAVNLPANASLVIPEQLPTVTHIRFIAAPDVRIAPESFRATIDLANTAVSDSENSPVRVQLVALDNRIQITDFEPQQISVTLDPIVHKTVGVRVIEPPGSIPTGLTLGTQTLSAQQVDVVGPESAVAKVAYAQAQVRIDASGLDFNDDADLVAVDSSGVKVDHVQLTPASVHVQIQIGSELRTQTVPVKAIIAAGAPAAGYNISAIDITPPVISVRGQADALALLGGFALTKAISIAGATSDVSAQVSLNLPAGVEAQGVTTVSVVVHLQSQGSTRTITVGVVPDGARSDRIYALSTPSITVTIGGATAALDAFDTSTLVATVSVGALDAGTYTVQVVINLPPGIKSLSVNPPTIQVTVTIPAPPPTPTPSPSPSPSPAPS